MPKGIDYSKWDSVELSDDDSDCHPNIDKDFWIRIKKEKREREKEDNAKEVVKLRTQAQEKRVRADELEKQAAAGDEADASAKRTEAEALRKQALDHEAAAEAIVDAERKRDWHVEDKFDYSAVNDLNRMDITKQVEAKKEAKAKAKAASGAGASGSAGAGSSSQGKWETIHAPGAGAGAPAAASAAAAAAPGAAAAEDGEADEAEEEALNDWVHDMEMKAQELGVLGNDPDCFDKSYEVIKKFPEVAVKETVDYLLLVGNDLAKRGEEELGRAFVHQSLMMQYCMDLSVNGANGVAQFFKRMNAGDDATRRKARGVFEAELDEYWGKILARARNIRKENEAKEKQEAMQAALKPPEAE